MKCFFCILIGFFICSFTQAQIKYSAILNLDSIQRPFTLNSALDSNRVTFPPKAIQFTSNKQILVLTKQKKKYTILVNSKDTIMFDEKKDMLFLYPNSILKKISDAQTVKVFNHKDELQSEGIITKDGKKLLMEIAVYNKDRKKYLIPYTCHYLMSQGGYLPKEK